MRAALLAVGCILPVQPGCQERRPPDASSTTGTASTVRASASASAPAAASASALPDPAAPGPPRIVAIGAGADHSFAVHSTGQVKAWGDNRDGELGLDKKTRLEPTPTTVPGLAGVVQIDGAGRRSCAVLRDGTAKCWGNNFAGALGDGKTKSRSAPAPVESGGGALQVQIAWGHGCVLVRDRTARCWGLIAQATPSEPQPQPVKKLTSVAGLALGGDTSFAWHSDGSVSTWDLELGKQWDYGSAVDGKYDNIRRSAARVKGIDDARALAASSTHVCALRRGGTLVCWGSGDRGQLGDGLFGSQYFAARPKPVAGLEDASCVAVGPSFTCACHASGKVSCWGRNEWGQLGLGDKKGRTKPALVAGLENITSLALGDNHSCALSTDGGVYCWGKNLHGQVGDGQKGIQATRLSPVRIEIGAP